MNPLDMTSPLNPLNPATDPYGLYGGASGGWGGSGIDTSSLYALGLLIGLLAGVFVNIVRMRKKDD